MHSAPSASQVLSALGEVSERKEFWASLLCATWLLDSFKELFESSVWKQIYWERARSSEQFSWQNERKREWFYMCWWTPKMATTPRIELIWSKCQELIQGPSTWIIFHCFSRPQAGSWIRSGAARTQTHTCICCWCFLGRGIACGAILVPVWQVSNQKTPGVISSVKIDTMVLSAFLLCFV